MRIRHVHRRLAATVALGVGVVLVGGIGIADAATGGTFIIGKTNYASTTTVLKNSAGVPLSLYAKTGRAPLAVNSGVKVTNLNADKLDGLDSTQLQRKIPALVWHPLTLANGWANYGSGTYGGDPAYTKDAFGFVHLTGVINGTSQTSQVIATLPAGFRPANGAWVVVGNSNGSYNPYEVNIWIGTGGDMTIVNGTTANDDFVSLEGVQFFAG